MPEAARNHLVIATALAAEAFGVRAGAPGATVVRAGLRARHAGRVQAALREFPDCALAVTGVAGALTPGPVPGDVVVAGEVRSARGTHRCPGAPLLAAALRRTGLTVHVGPIVEVTRIVGTTGRAALASDGAIAADMESAQLLDLAGGHPAAVVRTVSDTPSQSLFHPSAVATGLAGLTSLRRIGPALTRWAAATGNRKVLLAAPRSFCAGVERAIGVVRTLLEREGPPVYVRKQIVHNTRVVTELERRGAVFVDELTDVPDGALLVFSAHGVSPAVRAEAGRRGLRVVDATCPLVAKVHSEARRFARTGTVFLVGHAGHEEVEGTLGQVPGRVVLVESPEDVQGLDVPDAQNVSYVMQTTLAAEEAEAVVDALRARFPALEGPGSDDICYATTNRQHAVRAVARRSDLVLVAGSANSSNSRRLVEVVRRTGTPAHLVDDVADVDLAWLAGTRTIGLSAGASAPGALVDEIVDALSGLGAVTVEELRTTTETIDFSLPKEVRHP